MNILKKSMWVFDGARINLTELRPLKLSQFLRLFCIVGYGVCVILQFSIDHYETIHTCGGHIEDVHVGF